MANWNQLVSTSASVGGGIPVWAKLPERRIAGGIVKNTLAVGEKVSAGTPVYFDYVNKEAKFLKCWKIKTATEDSTNTILVLHKTYLTPTLKAGEFVMVMPSTMAGTGKAVAVPTITEDATTYTITVVTANMDTLAANGYLVQSSATAAGSSKSIYCQADNLSIEDTVGGDQNMLGVPVGMKYIFENCIPAIPAVVKANIKFVEWESFNEK